MVIAPNEMRYFQRLIEDKCGIVISEEKLYLIETRLTKVLADLGLNSFSELYDNVSLGRDSFITQQIIDAITTNETQWFRDKSPWLIIENLLLDRFLKDLRSGRKNKIRIWSAATSTGQEAYSTAMSIDNYLQTRFIRDVSLSDFEITATDISLPVLETAKSGKYDAMSISRGLDRTIKERYFKNVGPVWEIDSRLKKNITFRQFNLKNSFSMLGQFDIIFCRYVLIYFSEELKKDIVTRLGNALYDDGVLFLGAYEMCNQTGNVFSSRLAQDGAYYIKTPQL